jgi:Malate/lactate dehydrogenases
VLGEIRDVVAPVHQDAALSVDRADGRLGDDDAGQLDRFFRCQPVRTLPVATISPVPERTKVTVVGAGNVGATCAQVLARRDYADVVLVDIIPDFPQGKAWT